MKIQCSQCGYKTVVSRDLIKRVIGSGMILSGTIGWVTYAFAGILGFYGGAALIAAALIGGGAYFLAGKNPAMVTTIAQKITQFINQKGYPCPNCGKVDWQFIGFKDTVVITGDEHKVELLDSLESTRRELYIASGFLSSTVVNARFVEYLENTLTRGVNVYLIFSDARSHRDWMRPGFQAALNRLIEVSSKYPNLHIVQKHSHQKGIVVDESYAINGSFNFLSNHKVEREETGFKIFESRAIKKFKRTLLEQKAP